MILNTRELSDPAHPTIHRLRAAAARADELTDGPGKTVYARLIGTLVVDGNYEEALATYDRAVEQVGELGIFTREDILRSETRAMLGEDLLAELHGTLRFHLPDRRAGDTLLVSPELDTPVDSAYEPIPVPASGTVEVVRGVGTWPQRWVLRDADSAGGRVRRGLVTARCARSTSGAQRRPAAAPASSPVGRLAPVRAARGGSSDRPAAGLPGDPGLWRLAAGRVRPGPR